MPNPNKENDNPDRKSNPQSHDEAKVNRSSRGILSGLVCLGKESILFLIAGSHEPGRVNVIPYGIRQIF